MNITNRSFRSFLRRRALPSLTAAAAVGALLTTGPAHSAPAHRTSPVVTWAASTDLLGPAATQDRTYRLGVHASTGGSELRIRLSNAFGDEAVTFGRAHVGLPDSGAALVLGSNRPLSFGGSPTVTVPPGGRVHSDPLPGTVRPQSDLVVSLYVQQAGGPVTGRKTALQTSCIAPVGDHSGDESATAYTARGHRHAAHGRGRRH